MRHEIRRAALLGIALAAAPPASSDLLVSSRFSSTILRYDVTTGAFKSVFASGNGLANPNGIAFGPDGNLYVGLGDVGRVLKFARDGRFLGVFVADDPATPEDESGGNGGCRAIAFGPDGDLYVDAGSIDKVLRYDGKTGAYRGVAAEGHGMSGPVGMTFGPDGTLYVGAAVSNAIYAFGPGGAFLRQGTCGVQNTGVTGLVFGPDGLLYAAASVRNQILRYAPADLSCRGVFATGGGLNTPIGVAAAPNGELLVGSFGTNSVLRYSFQTGAFLGTLVAPGAGGLSGTHNFAFTDDRPEVTRLVPVVLDVATPIAHFTTELSLTNRGARDVVARLRFHPAGGAPASGEVSVALPAGRQTTLPDTIAFLAAAGAGLDASAGPVGTLEAAFVGADGPDAVAVTARTATSVVSPEGRAGLAYGGLRSGGTAPLAVFGLRESAQDRSNLALVNPSDAPVTLRVVLHSGAGDGATVVLRDAETLPPFGWLQYSGVLRDPGIANGWATVERVSSDGSFSAYGVVNDNVTSDGSYLAPAPASVPAFRLTVPVLVETAAFESELVLTNAGGAPAALDLSYVESLSPASGAGGTVHLVLQPHEQRLVSGALAALRGLGLAIGARGGAYAGALRISVAPGADGPVFAGARTSARAPSGGAFGLFTPALDAASLASSEAWVYGLERNASNRSNVAVLNAGADGDGDVRLEIQVYDGDAAGAPAGAPTPVTLGPGAWFQANNVLEGAGVATGWVRVRRVDGAAPWAAYGVVNDGGGPGQRTGDGAYVPMETPR